MATYDLTITSPNKINAGDILNCPYSGTFKSINLPKGKYKLECWGAAGGDGSFTNVSPNTMWYGGKGGYAAGTVTLNQSEMVFLYVGGVGQTRTANNLTSILSGGFNGGGSSPASSSSSDGRYLLGASGGGGTDIRIGQDSLYARVIVAGGGGGAGYGTSSGTSEIAGGAGGGASGQKGTVYADYSSRLANGATQTAGGTAGTSGTTSSGNAGTFGSGGDGAKTTGSSASSVSGSGGGGGWYGGGGGADGSACSGSGGGGSGYIYDAANASSYPSGCLLNESYYLSDTSCIPGVLSFTSPDGVSETGHSGDGYIRITVIAKNNSGGGHTPVTYDITQGPLGTTLTNLVKADGWVLNGVLYENGVFTFPADQGVHAYYQQSVSVIAGHKYYGRVYQKAGNPFTPTDSRFELWADDTTNIMIFATMESTASNANDTEGSWKKFSSIQSLDTVTASVFHIRTLGGNHGTPAYRKEHMVIDLTAAFGAGNEPTKAWCDKNIPYFEGTYTIPIKLYTGDRLNCPYTGTMQQIILPAGKYKLECWGAQGGSYNSSYSGGKGGYSTGILNLSEDTTLYLYAGQTNNSYGSSAGATSGTAFNGGGYGKTVYYKSTYTYSCAGGGGTDIRIGQDSLYARVIVAGGGSGSTNGSSGYCGGGLTSGGYDTTYQATQTSAGNLGSFGVGANSNPGATNYKYASAGGGGGWYGGGSSTSYTDSNSAYRKYHGGGSGYAYTSSTASNYPSGCLLNASYYLTEASTIAGSMSFLAPTGTSETGHSGSGYIRITVIEGAKLFPTMYLGEKAIIAGYLGDIPLLNMLYTLGQEVTTLGKLPIGSLIKDPNSTFLGKPIIWKIADINHPGYPNNSVTLISDRILASRPFDAAEPNNVDTKRQTYGNTRYSVSNIRQWLNSDANAGEWYSPQHAADTAPNSANIEEYYGTILNPYDTDAGFLNGFSNNFKNVLLDTELIVALNVALDGGESEIITDKIFLASTTEVGLANSNNIIEGALLPIFNDNASRIAYCTAEAVEDTDYGSPVNDTTAWYWWLRTGNNSSSILSRAVGASGAANSWYPFSGRYSVRPLCNIPSSTKVSSTPDKDGCYRLIF